MNRSAKTIMKKNTSTRKNNGKKPNTERHKPRPILKICLICLQAEEPLKTIEDPILFFYEELCSFSCKEKYKYACMQCFEVLKKCFYFHKQCEYATKLLNEWYKQDDKKRENLNQLHHKLESHNFEDSDSDLNPDTEVVIPDGEQKDGNLNIKSEEEEEDEIDLFEVENNVSFEPIDEIEDHKYKRDTLRNKESKTIQKLKPDNKEISKSSIHHFKIVKTSKAKHDIVMIDNTDADDIDSSMTDIEAVEDSMDSDDDYIDFNNSEAVKMLENIIKEKDIKKGVVKTRKILKNLHEYEKVFDIQLFSDDNKAKEEFAQRKFSKHYLVGEHKCEEYYLLFQSEKHLVYHKNWHDPSRMFVCSICPMRFNEEKRMHHHTTVAHVGRFACKACPLVTYHTNSMMRHYEKHAGFKFKCNICDKVFRHQSSLWNHQRTAHIGEHTCALCARTFVSQQGLGLHYKLIHKGKATEVEGGVRCEQCNITFINKQVYLIHIKNTPIHKDLADSILACKRCGMEFTDKLLLTDHIKKQHSKVKNKSILTIVKCKICDVTGESNVWLQRHMRSEHDGTPITLPFLCTTCGRGFRTSHLLGDHENVHTGAKPYRCETCEKCFRTKDRLKVHIQTHAPPTRACHECGKKFVSSANLYNHSMIHKGDRRHKCQICDKGFLNPASLKSHINSVHLQIRRNRKSRAKVVNNKITDESIVNEEIIDYE